MNHIEKAPGAITCSESGSGYASVADAAQMQRIAPDNPDWAAIDAGATPWVCGCCKEALRDDSGLVERAQQAADAIIMQAWWDFGTVSATS
jgi:hypothetical protein